MVLNESYLIKKKNKHYHPVNLIVCPTTITYNWKAEIKKYFDKNIRVAIYEGSAQEKNDIIKNAASAYDVIIISYEKLSWFMLLLDEFCILFS